MTLVHRQLASGLVVAEDAADERAIQAAVKQIRRDFSLQKRQRLEALGGGLVYKIVHVPSGIPVISWTDDSGRPLPLSSGILERFKKHLLGERGADWPDFEEHNRRLEEANERQRQADSDAIWSEHEPRIARGRVTVGPGSLGQARRGRRRY